MKKRRWIMIFCMGAVFAGLMGCGGKSEKVTEKTEMKP